MHIDHSYCMFGKTEVLTSRVLVVTIFSGLESKSLLYQRC